MRSDYSSNSQLKGSVVFLVKILEERGGVDKFR